MLARPGLGHGLPGHADFAAIDDRLLQAGFQRAGWRRLQLQIDNLQRHLRRAAHGHVQRRAAILGLLPGADQPLADARDFDLGPQHVFALDHAPHEPGLRLVEDRIGLEQGFLFHPQMGFGRQQAKIGLCHFIGHGLLPAGHRQFLDPCPIDRGVVVAGSAAEIVQRPLDARLGHREAGHSAAERRRHKRAAGEHGQVEGRIAKAGADLRQEWSEGDVGRGPGGGNVGRRLAQPWIVGQAEGDRAFQS